MFSFQNLTDDRLEVLMFCCIFINDLIKGAISQKKKSENIFCEKYFSVLMYIVFLSIFSAYL